MLFIITSINVKMPSKYTKETLIIEIEKYMEKGHMIFQKWKIRKGLTIKLL